VRAIPGLFALAAGGMLVSLTLLHIAPEAFELSTHTPVFLMVGFFGGLVLHFGIGAAFPERSDRGRAAAITPIAAVAIHSLLDGMIYSVTFAASFSSGVYAAASLMLHEFPEGRDRFCDSAPPQLFEPRSLCLGVHRLSSDDPAGRHRRNAVHVRPDA
jgi:zinc transporter ZupT